MGKVAHAGIIEKIMPAVQNRAMLSRRKSGVTTQMKKPASTTVAPRNNLRSCGLSMTPISPGTGLHWPMKMIGARSITAVTNGPGSVSGSI